MRQCFLSLQRLALSLVSFLERRLQSFCFLYSLFLVQPACSSRIKFLSNNWGGGGTAYTMVLEAITERFVGSSPTRPTNSFSVSKRLSL
jgi:hypothetical protein